MKSLAAFLAAVSVIVMLPIAAFAHPGRTDSSGGHTNHSTGEYHYHHGYPAHDHYDIDGDGRPDCPYNFQDRTGQNSGSSGNSTNSGNSATSSPPRSTITATNVSEPEKEEEEVPAWVYIAFFGLGLTIVILCFIIRTKNEEIDEVRTELKWKQEAHNNALAKQKECFDQDLDLMAQKHAQRIASIEDGTERRIADAEANASETVRRYETKYRLMKTVADSALRKNDELKDQLRCAASDKPKTNIPPISAKQNPHLSSISIPEEVYFTDDYTPVTGDVSGLMPYGAFTVFVSDTGKVFHSSRRCGSGFLRAVHVYDVADEKRPCSRCGSSHCDGVPSWYKEIKQITTSKAFKEYIAKPK